MENNLLLSKKFNSFCCCSSLAKTFIFLMIYSDLIINVKLFKAPLVAVSSANVSTFSSSFSSASSASSSSSSSPTLSIFMTSRVDDDDNDNDVLTINNFDENFPNKNQITFDTLQPKVHTDDDNDLLSIVEKCTRTTTAICGSNSITDDNDTHTDTTDTTTPTTPTTTTTFNKFTTKAPQLESVITTTDMITAPTTTIATATTKTSMSDISHSSSSSSSLFPITLSSSSSPSSLQPRLFSRPKRYLSFPEGSSFSVAVCFTVGIIGNPRYNYMSFGLNWGVAYDLPNTSWILNHLHGFAKRPIPVAVWHRRSRRALYREIENVVDNMGYNGRDCILRALCESRQYFQKTKMSMIGEMLRVMFSLPKQRLFTRELDDGSDIELYDRAYRKARSVEDCSEQYDCSFSLLELAFGKYSTAPEGYYGQH